MVWDSIKNNIELAASAVGVIGFVFSCLAGLVVWLWKVSKWVGGLETPSEREAREKALAASLEAIRMGLAEAKILLIEREKDTDKLTGAFELTRKELGETNGALRDLAKSLDKLWATVEKKPLRFSDK